MLKTLSLAWTSAVHLRRLRRLENSFLCMTTTLHRYVRVIPILNKSDTHELCLEFIAWSKRQKMHGEACTL